MEREIGDAVLKVEDNAEAHGRAAARTVQPLVGNSGGEQ